MSSLTVEECELLSDAKYRTYINQVEKALKSFEYTSEWADLISALGKLNKVLLNHIKYPVVPKKVTIGKRLAQCLHPALPSGVHLKALETYDIIFKCIGTPRLAQDLFVYSAGLFPLMGHAAMNVKPALLGIYEKHFTQLGKQVKPGLNGLLLGLLPGLEEGSEYYDRTNRLMEKFCEAAGAEFFYTCLWECIMTCPSVRLPACTYLTTHYNKKKSMEDQLYLMGHNIDLMVGATCSAVQDSSVLVQRCILDFLLTAFPMHNAQLTRPDTGKIVNAALCVLLRRDMSLNRRLYAWLLGTDAAGNPVFNVTDPSKKGRTDSSSVTGELDMTFFQTYSKDKLVAALNNYLTLSTETASSASDKMLALRPFRILISLLDKPEIGPAIIEDILLAVFRCLYRECVTKARASTEDSASGHRQGKLERSSSITSQTGAKFNRQDSVISVEMVKTANLLFNTLEPYFIWDFIAKSFESTCLTSQGTHTSTDTERHHNRDIPSLLELCQLVDFLLDIVSLETYMETTTEHLPDLLRHMTSSLTNHCVMISDDEITSSLQLCAKILQKVQPSMNILGNEAQERDSEVFLAGDQDIDITTTFPTVTQDNIDTKQTIDADAQVISLDTEKESICQAKSENSEGSNKEDFDEVNSQTTVSRKASAVTVTSGQSETDDQYADKSALQEFQKYNSIEIERSPSRVSYRISGPLTLMQACVQSFQEFFYVFVCEKILRDKDLSKKCLELITLSPDSGKYSDRDSVLEGGSIYSQEEVSPVHVPQPGSNCVVSSDMISNHLCEAFSSACKLLVDFSSFPMYCTDYHKLMDQTLHQDEEMTLPCWLQGLITCTSFVESFNIKSSAISTMLDLIILTQSVQSETESKDAEQNQQRSVTEGTISVVILPLLLPRHLHFLNTSTLFYRMVAEALWEYLAGESTAYHQTSVELFHQLHQVNPNSWICEDVIGNALIQDEQQKRIDAYKKFTVLWHLTRDKRMETTPGRQIRTYDRSMFVVLDSLKEDTHPTQTITTTWLTHSLQRGDMGRILEPILLMLFHPDTARISIQHVNIHQPKKIKLNEVDDVVSSEAKIYAISNEGGNVIYHVSSQGKTISKKGAEELKSYALTVVNEKGSKSQFVTAPTRAQPDMPFERVNADMLNLRVNPFGTENLLDRLVFDGMEIPGVQIPATVQGGDPPDMGSIKRLDKETCQKEGIVFEDKDHEEGDINLSESLEHSEETVQNMVAQILEELIDEVTGNDKSGETKDNTSAVINTGTESTVPLRSTRENSVVSRDSTSLAEEDLLNAIEHHGLNIDSPSGSEVDLTKQSWGTLAEAGSTDIHTLHMHILLYTQKYDFQRTLYALTTLKSLIQACPRLVVVSMATCSISAVRTPHLVKVQTLLARHRKSVFGKNFFGEVPPETLSTCRSNMYLEIVVSVLLYFIRSYYPNLMMSKLSPEELMGNREVHILSGEILTLIMSELILITKDSGKSFASYMDSLLIKCKLQKALLHCVLASIYNARRKTSQELSTSSFTEAVVDFNEKNLDASAVETFQIKLLQLLRVMVQLEDHIIKAKGELETVNSNATTEWDRSKINFQPSFSHVRYNPVLPMVQQGMFLSGILSALKQQHLAHMHRHWVAMVTSSLPFMGKALSHIVMSVVSQLCRNLEMLAQAYGTSKKVSSHGLQRVPPDHMLTMLEGLTTLCHYCLLDSSPQVSLGAPLPSGSTNTSEASTYASQIIFNLLHVFNPVSGKESSPPRDVNTAVSPVMEARRALLSILPRIIACLATIWKAISVSNQEAVHTQLEQPNWTMGSPKIIQRYILDFLSPLSQSHGVNLLGAVAVAWNDRRKKTASQNKRVISVPCADQLLLVDLVSEIKVLPTDKLVQLVKQVMKQPPPSELTKHKKSIPLEVNLLQFFFAYIQQTGSSQLIDSWPSLLALIKEGLQLNISPPGQFLLLEILNETVQRMPVMEDRKCQKELQDIVQKVLDSVSSIAGSCLAQTTWLRRNLAVRPGPQTDIHDVEDGDVNEESDLERSPPPERKVIAPQNSNSEISKYSVQALTQLAERTARLLDVVYGSEEKEKVVPFLTSTMYNVFPYLRNHSPHNLPSFRACSQFLSSISGYQYTRKSWRKEALEFLLDASFFQMDQKCIGYWETIIDNLMTHDKTTFKDLMTRVSVVQTGSLNLFSSKDQEFEQRTLLLKRLAFTLFCSEADQYQRNMPEIQERLSESLRLPQVPSVMAQVFLCFRVLILRMSPQHLTSLWPTIITEMVQVFLQIEQELSTETDEFKAQLQRIAALDSTWAHLGNGLNAHNNPAWLQLYLSACKLLDLALALPADVIPQFQLYRWAFIGEDCTDDEESKRENAWTKPTFVPHIVRITRLINTKVPRECSLLHRSPGKPLLMMTYLRSLVELQPFFNTLATMEEQDNGQKNTAPSETQLGSMSKSRSAPEFGQLSRHSDLPSPIQSRSVHQHLELSVERDFLEFLPAS